MFGKLPIRDYVLTRRVTGPRRSKDHKPRNDHRTLLLDSHSAKTKPVVAYARFAPIGYFLINYRESMLP